MKAPLTFSQVLAQVNAVNTARPAPLVTGSPEWWVQQDARTASRRRAVDKAMAANKAKKDLAFL